MNEVPRKYRSVGARTVSRLDEDAQSLMKATAARIHSPAALGFITIWLGSQIDPEYEIPPQDDLHDAFQETLKLFAQEADTNDDGKLRDLSADVTTTIDDYIRDIKPHSRLDSLFNLASAFIMRGGIAYRLGDYAAASEDAATAFHPVAQIVPDDASMLPLARALELKGQAEYQRGELETAKEDLRTCCAYKRALGEDLFKSDEVRWLLGVMARLKDGAPRPHYSVREAYQVCRELELDHYSSKCMRCIVCQQEPSADVRLRLCGGCQLTWYCSRKCQKANWKEHKPSCQPILPKSHVVVAHTLEAKFKAAIDAGGFAFTEHKNGGTQALCVDPETGRMFQSLSDQDVTFHDPEGEDKGQLAMMMMGTLLLGGGNRRRDGAMGSGGPVSGMQFPDPHIIYP